MLLVRMSTIRSTNSHMKLGSLVRGNKGKRIGIVVDIFDDLDEDNPWIRVRWTYPSDTYEWCKKSGLIEAEEEIQEDKRGS